MLEAIMFVISLLLNCSFFFYRDMDESLDQYVDEIRTVMESVRRRIRRLLMMNKTEDRTASLTPSV
jgi:hypothetical protein